MEYELTEWIERFPVILMEGALGEHIKKDICFQWKVQLRWLHLLIQFADVRL